MTEIEPSARRTGAERRSSSSSSPTASESVYGSTTALVLVPDDESLFGSEEEDFLDDESSGNDGQRASSSLINSLTPMPIYVLLLLLVTPTLLLGTVMLPAALTSPGSGFRHLASTLGCYAIPCILSAFSGHIWVLLGRYLRKWSIEEVISYALAGVSVRTGSRHEMWRRRLTKSSRVALCVACCLLCTVYLRVSVDLMLSQISNTPTLLLRVVVTAALATVLLPLLLTSITPSKRLMMSAAITFAAHILLIVFVVTRYFRGEPKESVPPGMTSRSLRVISTFNWDGIVSLAFAFASPIFTYPLNAAYLHKAPSPLDINAKNKRLPYPALLVASAVTALLLLLPIVLSNPIPTSPIPFIQSVSLAAGIPPLWIIAISPRLPSVQSLPHIARWKFVLWISLVLFVMLEPPILSQTIKRIVVLVFLFFAYPLPATLHILIHYFRSPLSILISQSPAPEDGEPDALLRRKERSLQRRRLWRRIFWDLGAWALLGPFGCACCAWQVGRVFGVW